MAGLATVSTLVEIAVSLLVVQYVGVVTAHVVWFAVQFRSQGVSGQFVALCVAQTVAVPRQRSEAVKSVASEPGAEKIELDRMPYTILISSPHRMYEAEAEVAPVGL